jgi:hypothetical protein
MDKHKKCGRWFHRFKRSCDECILHAVYDEQEYRAETTRLEQEYRAEMTRLYGMQFGTQRIPTQPIPERNPFYDSNVKVGPSFVDGPDIELPSTRYEVKR